MRSSFTSSSVVPSVPIAPRVQTLWWWDSITVSATKGVFLRSALQTCVAWFAALHIKHPGLSVSAQAASTKSAFPAWSTTILAVEFCTGQDYQTTANMAVLCRPQRRTMNGWRKGCANKVSSFTVSIRNLLFGSFAQRCGSLILFISRLKFFFWCVLNLKWRFVADSIQFGVSSMLKDKQWSLFCSHLRITFMAFWSLPQSFYILINYSSFSNYKRSPSVSMYSCKFNKCWHPENTSTHSQTGSPVQFTAVILISGWDDH